MTDTTHPFENAFIAANVLRKAVLAPSEEAQVRIGKCPKCGDRLFRKSEAAGVTLLQCIDCGCGFLLAA